MKDSSSGSPLSRREFLAATGMAATVLPSVLVGAGRARGALAPNERIALGCIGVGEQGNGIMGAALAQPDVRVLAVCDVKKSARDSTRERVNQHYGNQDCQVYADYRELLARQDLDGVLIATPDHWHVLVALAACQAGKDLYLEKPMGLSLAEDRALRTAVNRHQRVFQFGTQQRSSRDFRRACELVRSGLIGKLRHIDVWCMGSVPGGPTEAAPVPEDIDYDFWVGPAPFKPYTEMRTHANWQRKTWWYEYEYALGFIAGWGVHPLDIAYWGAGDLARCNVEVEGMAMIPDQGACNTPTNWNIHFAYASGVTMTYQACPITLNGGPADLPEAVQKKYGGGGLRVADHGTAFVGENGWVHVNRGGYWAEPQELMRAEPGDGYVRLYESSHHMRNFVDCMRSRQKTVCPVEEAVQADLLCHLSDQAVRRGRKLRWEFEAERFMDDEAANRRLESRPLRAPWVLPEG